MSVHRLFFGWESGGLRRQPLLSAPPGWRSNVRRLRREERR
jgi:hypothetical protein